MAKIGQNRVARENPNDNLNLSPLTVAVLVKNKNANKINVVHIKETPVIDPIIILLLFVTE